MERFHINPETGEPGRCTAQIKCPYGDLETDHYPSPEIARLSYEIKMKAEELTNLRKEHTRLTGRDELDEITGQQRESIVNRGVFETESTTFRKVSSLTGGLDNNWVGKTNGTASDVSIVLNTDQQGTRSYISIDNELTLLHQNPEVRGFRAKPEKMANEMSRALRAAKKIHPEEFSPRRTVREAELNYDEGVITIGSVAFTRDEVPGSDAEHWTQRKKNGSTDYQIRIIDNIATLEDYRNGKLVPVYKKELNRGVDKFKDGAEAARFMLAAEPRLKRYEEDLK